MVDRRPPPTILSFYAKLVSSNRDDELREFVVAFFLEDSSFCINELVIPNSGFKGGRFLVRTKEVNPETNAPYAADDITVGAIVTIREWKFLLVSATEGALRTMEAKSDKFTRSDLSALIVPLITDLKPRLGELRAAFVRRDKYKRGRLKNDEVRNILDEFGFKMDAQQWITLSRRFQFADSDTFRYNDLLAHIG
jgi:hypothetical protein